MGLHAYLSEPFYYEHENHIFDELFKKLSSSSLVQKKEVYLFGNVLISGNAIDALLIKNNAIIVIDFKDYGGHLTISENSEWEIKTEKGETVLVKGGHSQNPFKQIKIYKNAVARNLQEFISFRSNPNLKHIAGICLFHQPVYWNYYSLPHSLRLWFHICSIDAIVRKIDSIRSQEITLSDEEMIDIAIHIGAQNYESIEPNSISKKEDKKQDNSNIENNTTERQIDESIKDSKKNPEYTDTDENINEILENNSQNEHKKAISIEEIISMIYEKDLNQQTSQPSSDVLKDHNNINIHNNENEEQIIENIETNTAEHKVDIPDNQQVNILDNLNEEQKIAVTTIDGYVRVIAGPGTGKTKTISARFAYLINKMKISASNILCLTFTNKAAKEMRDRVKQVVPNLHNELIKTFHGFCVYFLRAEAYHLGIPKNFSIMDSHSDLHDFLSYKNNKLHYIENFPEKLHDYKSQDINRYISNYFDISDEDLERLLEKEKEQIDYQNRLKTEMLFSNPNKDIDIQLFLLAQRKYHYYDFDDLIYITLYILKKFPKVQENWSDNFKYIMVDEYQDINEDQMDLIELMSQKNGNLYVVGDEDQCIYSWRGSSPRFLIDFEKKHPTCSNIILKQNYRSANIIIKAANDLIGHNQERLKDKQIFSKTKENGAVITKELNNTSEEAIAVAQKILEIKKQYNIPYSSFAVIFRANYMSAAFESAFSKANIPFVVYKATDFFNIKEIKSILDLFQISLNPNNEILLYNTIKFFVNEFLAKDLTSKIFEKNKTSSNPCLIEKLEQLIEDMKSHNGKRHNFNVEKLDKNIEFNSNIENLDRYVEFIETLVTKTSSNCSCSTLLEIILSELKWEPHKFGDKMGADLVDTIVEFRMLVSDFDEKSTDNELHISTFLDEISLLRNKESITNNNDSVKLLTAHTSKGLEFDYVFLPRFNNGDFPHWNGVVEEERRLAYVAITRARRELYISYVLEKQNKYGKTIDASPSSFIDEIFPEHSNKQNTSLSHDKNYDIINSYDSYDPYDDYNNDDIYVGYKSWMH